MLVHPWQWLTAAAGIHLSLPLPCPIHLSELQADLEHVRRGYRPNAQEGPYHDGSWKRLGLISPDGDPRQAYLTRPGQTRRPTPVLDLMPSVRKLFADTGLPVRSAFLSVMEPGARVRWHRDASHSVDLSIVRLHVPILTDPSSIMRIGHQTVHWDAGHLWYADFSFPHSVHNGWDQQRIHLIIDVLAAEDARAFFPADYLAAARTRRVVRKAVGHMFDFSQRLHSAGREAKRARAARNAAEKAAPTAPPAE